MRDILQTEFASVGDVVAGLERLEAHCLPRRDRRGVFATAYLQITRAIQAEIIAGSFHDDAWAARYLVCFGNLYREALLAYEIEETRAVPRAWCMAFDEARNGTGLVIQHLVLGINAHINHDLALALGEVGIDPEREKKYQDHARVNEVLEAATERLKTQVSTMYAPLLQRLDWVAGRLDDDFTRFSIPRARDHAWGFAVAIAGARSDGDRSLLLRTLDEQAAVMARWILSPPTRHPMLLRAVKVAARADSAVRRALDLFGGSRR
ncbi:MAG: DUF5995 family protein [Gemmatimonadota bacterium]